MTGDSNKHVCCVFDSPGAFSSAAARFLRRGLHQERLLYIADRTTRAELYDDLIELGDVELLVDEGELVTQTAEQAYFGEQLDPAGQIESFRALLNAALADGFKGLRVAADVTGLVDSDGHRRTFMAYELAVDRFISSVPIWGMCAFNGSVLDDKAVDLACVHRYHDVASPKYEPGFSLWTAGMRDGAAVAVGGVVEGANVHRFTAALDASVVALPLLAESEGPLVVDAGALEFIDAAGAAALAGFAERMAPYGGVMVAEPPRSLCAVIESLGLEDRLQYVR